MKRLDMHLGPEELPTRVPLLQRDVAGGSSLVGLLSEWFLSVNRLLGNKCRISEKWKWCSKAGVFVRPLFWLENRI